MDGKTLGFLVVGMFVGFILTRVFVKWSKSSGGSGGSSGGQDKPPVHRK